jgi:GT2 family glycosyltransferase
VLVGNAQKMTAVEAFERVFAFNNRRYVEQLGFTVTANLFCTRAVFEGTGGFRNGVSEDLEWCHRARDRGYRIGYAPAAIVGHPARADWAALIHKWRRINAETFALCAGRPGGKLAWAGRSLILPLSILAHLPRIATSRAVSGLRLKLAAMGVLVRIRAWRMVDSWRLLLPGGGR